MALPGRFGPRGGRWYNARMERRTHTPKPDPVQDEIRVGWKMAALGMEVAGQAMGGALLGWLFDRWQGTEPTGVMIGSIIGITAGLFSLVRGGLKLNRQLERAHPTRGRGRPLQEESRPPGAGEGDSWDHDPWDENHDDDEFTGDTHSSERQDGG